MTIFNERKRDTKDNHIISQFFQKQYGINYKKNIDFKPVFYIEDKNKTIIPYKKWETKDRFMKTGIFSQDLEESYHQNEINTANLFNKATKLNKFLSKINTQINNFNNEFLFDNNNCIDHISKNGRKYLSRFYASILERKSLSEMILNINSIIDKTEQDCFKLPNLTITKKEQLNKLFLECRELAKKDPHKVVRKLNDLGLPNAKLFKKIEKWIYKQLINNQFVIVHCNVPIFFLSDNPFISSTNTPTYERTSICIFNILPLNSYSILVNKDYLKNYSNLFDLSMNYLYSIKTRSNVFMFSSLEHKEMFYQDEESRNALKLDEEIANNLFTLLKNQKTVQIDNNQIKNYLNQVTKHELSWWSQANHKNRICWYGASILKDYDIYHIVFDNDILFYKLVNQVITPLLLIENKSKQVIRIRDYFIKYLPNIKR